MAKKSKKNQLPEAPIDKMDEYFKQNYKKIIGVVSAVLIVFLVGYGVKNMMDRTKQNKNNMIGTYERGGLETPEQIETFSSLANTYAYAKDYIYIQTAESYARLGDAGQAAEAAKKAGGSFSAHAESLKYDLEGGSIPPNALGGPFSAVWYYRAVLAAQGEERAALLAEFRGQWPDSLLLGQLDKWGIN